MMIVKGLRWGYDGGGFGCGPMDGNMAVELQVRDGSGREWYILNTVYMCYEIIEYCSAPMYDAFMNWMGRSLEGAQEAFEALEATAVRVECDDSQWRDTLETLQAFDREPLGKAVRLTRLAMLQYLNTEGWPEQKDADAFIAPYLDRDIDGMEFEIANFQADEDDEYEEYDDEEVDEEA